MRVCVFAHVQLYLFNYKSWTQNIFCWQFLNVYSFAFNAFYWLFQVANSFSAQTFKHFPYCSLDGYLFKKLYINNKILI